MLKSNQRSIIMKIVYWYLFRPYRYARYLVAQRQAKAHRDSSSGIVNGSVQFVDHKALALRSTYHFNSQSREFY